MLLMDRVPSFRYERPSVDTKKNNNGYRYANGAEGLQIYTCL